MNALLEIQKRIELTNEEIARTKRLLQTRPDSAGLLHNLETFSSAHTYLMKEFESTAKQTGIEVCSYRLFQENTDRKPISGIGKAFISFQNLFSIVYDAVKRGQPKKQSQVSDEVIAETTLDFAYTFPGSIGIALTVPSQVSLFGNYFQETINELFHMARLSKSEDLRVCSRKLGIAPVRALYAWADDLVKADFGVEVQWKGVQNEPSKLFVQRPELHILREAILATSEEHHEEFTLVGILKGVDIDSRSFHFQYKEEKKRRDIRGHFIDTISQQRPVKVPAEYRVTIARTTRTNYSMDKDEVRDILLRIEPLSGNEKEKTTNKR